MEWIVAAVLLLVAGVVLLFVARSLAKSSRYAKLMAKYGDEKLVHALVTQTIWQGMTTEQLKDSWGEPVAIEQKVMKTKVREVFKYKPLGKNRFRDKVTLEDGLITGWDQK
jgi:hypothetical protein